MLKKPLIIDFNSDKKYFDLNLNEIYILGAVFIAVAGLLYFYDGLGFIISIIIIFLLFVVRLVSVVWGTLLVSEKMKILVNANTGTWYDPQNHGKQTACTQTGIWHDPSTNLTWMRCSLGQKWDGKTCVGTAQKYTWQEAQQAVAEMNRNGGYAGYTDWVVPDIEALHSLLRDHGRVPKIDHAIFPNTPDSFYWSASPLADYDDDAWYVYFRNGNSYYGGKSDSYYVRAVRAGQ